MIAETDVCVIGGGPAGATVAARLVSLGHRVTVLERAAAAPARSAASLPATILPLLEFFGARESVERAGFIRSARTIVWWSGSAPAIREDSGPPALHVERAKFDRLMLDHARNAGVLVLHGTAFKPRRVSSGWSTVARVDDESVELRSLVVVDAAGSANMMPGGRRRMCPRLIALCAEWSNMDSTVDGLIEAGDAEWFWCAPISQRTVVVTVFTEPSRLSGLARPGVERLYEDLAGRFRLFCLKGATSRKSQVTICDASSHYAEEPAGQDYVRAGDAAFKLDPLSSQGVQSAVATSIQASIVVNTLLRRPGNADAALEFYTRNQRHLVRKHAAASEGFYAERAAVCELPFWTDRAGSAGAEVKEQDRVRPIDGDCRIQLSDAATTAPIPAAQGDLIEWTPGVSHPHLERPIVFIGAVEVAPLLRQIVPGDTMRTLAERWARCIPADLAWQIAGFLWNKQVLVARA